MTTDYDIVAVGGGLGGSALAKAMAERGYKVLVLEREKEFKDRVRGEYMFPWGVAEAKSLGLYDVLMEECGHHPQYMEIFTAGGSIGPRDFSETTPQKVHALCFYHPAMQETLLKAAESAGAEVRRGVRVRSVTPGSEPTATIEANGSEEMISARLIVGADGRNSMVRKWGGFDILEDERGMQLAGLLLDNVDGVDDRAVTVFNPFSQRIALLLPQGGGRVRAYLGYRIDEELRLQGDKDVPRFLEESVKTGGKPELYQNATQAGPLATFPCIYEWIDHPYKDGVALVGDAATTSDPTWGQGLSLTVGAVRRLRDALLENEDWDAAGDSFAAAVKGMWDPIRTVEMWFAEVLMGKGQEADAIRIKALTAMGQDQDRVPDVFNSGPDVVPVNEETRRRFFGED